jgi:hypothetical protein
MKKKIGKLSNFRKLLLFDSSDDFLIDFQVKLLGEGADDAGGVFDDVITEMCRELVAPHSDLNLLVLTPNGVNDIGLNRDKYLLNSQLCLKNNSKDRKHLWFLGEFSYCVLMFVSGPSKVCET